MPKLSKSEFEATFDDDVEQAGDGYSPCVDFWDYVDSLTDDQTDGYNHLYTTEMIFHNPKRKIEHILLRTDGPHVFLTIVIDQDSRTIIGHHLFRCDPIYHDSL